MKYRRQRQGQFVIIAVMLAAIMMVSIGALMHGAITYYKHEPWEEYSALVGDIELNSHRLLELSIATYTQTDNAEILADNLKAWHSDLHRMYSSRGVALEFTVQELSKTWGSGFSVAVAKANFTLSIGSIGLAGYKFTTEALLKMIMQNHNSTAKTVEIIVYSETELPVSDLKKANFAVNDLPVNVTTSYDSSYAAIKYLIQYQGTSPPTIKLWDNRGICLVGTP